MTAELSPRQNEASHELVRSLAKLPISDLVRFTLQKPDVARIVASSLNLLAVEVASSPLPHQSDTHLARSHVNILVRLIERGDPSLARKFVPTQGSLVDLAVTAPPEAKSSVITVLERLLDATSVKEILTGLSAQLKSVISSQTQHEVNAISPIIRTLARLSSAFLSVCPARLIKGNADIVQSWTQTCFQLYDKVLPQVAKDLAGDVAGLDLEQELLQMDGQSWQLHWLTCRVDLLQLLSNLLDNLKGSSALVTVLRNGLADTEKILDKGGFSVLLNSTALLDLAATSNSWPSLRSELLSSSAVKKNKADETISSIDTLASIVPKFTGAAWDALQRFVASQPASAAAKGKSRQQPASIATVVSEQVLTSVDSVLPHYGMDRLRTILSQSSFAGQSVEMVIQRLLEGDEGDTDPPTSVPSQPAALPAVESESLVVNNLERHSKPTSSSAEVPSLVKSRANLFGDFGFDPSTIVQPKFERSGRVDELAPELKAAILARAEAADDDEAEEEWNPFAEPHRTVGVEDELDLDYDGRERGAALPRHTAHDGTDDEDAEDGGGDSARARERVLLRYYVQNGSHSFSADASTRKSEARKRLKEATGWSDDLIESWAVMLERNPKKDRLFAAASQNELDEQTASRDQSRNVSHVDDDHNDDGGVRQRRWGPDRGRGGRILGEGRGGRGGGGGSGVGRGGGSGGGGGGRESSGTQSKNATRGRGTGNSGTDRSAKQKERAGNKARQKGHDKKMARVAL
ncbi:uncharacterized protein MEPE_00745 [Melanopsichium pennsylvanicum]|uniref:CUE domain-containing protein n=2 Tax=Melanopsichium pennsylvanicum TaxID=63383 RepID=A0AAJ4XGH8_9BASI|nr:uncharacterized protein MEPE_00745 [Melanopsichium pennsylvanicum]